MITTTTTITITIIMTTIIVVAIKHCFSKYTNLMVAAYLAWAAATNQQAALQRAYFLS